MNQSSTLPTVSKHRTLLNTLESLALLFTGNWKDVYIGVVLKDCGGLVSYRTGDIVFVRYYGENDCTIEYAPSAAELLETELSGRVPMTYGTTVGVPRHFIQVIAPVTDFLEPMGLPNV